MSAATRPNPWRFTMLFLACSVIAGMTFTGIELGGVYHYFVIVPLPLASLGAAGGFHLLQLALRRPSPRWGTVFAAVIISILAIVVFNAGFIPPGTRQELISWGTAWALATVALPAVIAAIASLRPRRALAHPDPAHPDPAHPGPAHAGPAHAGPAHPDPAPSGEP